MAAVVGLVSRFALDPHRRHTTLAPSYSDKRYRVSASGSNAGLIAFGRSKFTSRKALREPGPSSDLPTHSTSKPQGHVHGWGFTPGVTRVAVSIFATTKSPSARNRAEKRTARPTQPPRPKKTKGREEGIPRGLPIDPERSQAPSWTI